MFDLQHFYSQLNNNTFLAELENLVLENAAREERFAGDDYIQSERPKSILCAPIIHKSSLSGIIYLENKLIEGAFTPQRLEVIKHLASQIAISDDNPAEKSPGRDLSIGSGPGTWFLAKAAENGQTKISKHKMA